MKFENELAAAEYVFQAYDSNNVQEFWRAVAEVTEARNQQSGFKDCNCTICKLLRADLDSHTKQLLLAAYAQGRAEAAMCFVYSAESAGHHPTNTDDHTIDGLLAATEVDYAACGYIAANAMAGLDEAVKKVFTQQQEDNSVDPS